MKKLFQLTEKLISPMDERDRLIASIGLWASWGGGFFLLFFVTLLLISGIYLPAFLWLGWAVWCFILPIIIIRARKFLAWAINLHLISLLAVPFIVDYLLGGFSRLGYPGYVIMFIIVAAVYARERIVFWIILGTVALFFSILVEPTITFHPLLHQWVAQAWIGGSTIVSMWVAAMMISYFTIQRDHALEKLAAEEEKLRQLATSDPLTGPYNRRYFYEQGEQTHQLSVRYQHPYSVLMIDLDNFKRVNDVYNHAAGDEVLRETARRLRGSIRTVDILGRYGGEEFTILLPETNLPNAEQTAERLLENLRSTPIDIGPAELTITASIGVVQSDPASTETFPQVVERADQAHYRAKGQGKNRVTKAE